MIDKDAHILVPMNSDVLQDVGERDLDRAYPLNVRNPRDEQSLALALVGLDDIQEKMNVAQVQVNTKEIPISSMGEQILIANHGHKLLDLVKKSSPEQIVKLEELLDVCS